MYVSVCVCVCVRMYVSIIYSVSLYLSDHTFMINIAPCSSPLNHAVVAVWYGKGISRHAPTMCSCVPCRRMRRPYCLADGDVCRRQLEVKNLIRSPCLPNQLERLEAAHRRATSGSRSGSGGHMQGQGDGQKQTVGTQMAAGVLRTLRHCKNSDETHKKAIPEARENSDWVGNALHCPRGRSLRIHMPLFRRWNSLGVVCLINVVGNSVRRLLFSDIVNANVCQNARIFTKHRRQDEINMDG